jgi:hypothetical protein
VKRAKSILQYSGLLLIVIAAACAKISAPSGGPRDKQPPVIVESVPENGSKWFKAKSFEVTFDEFVVIDKIDEKFMASPPLKKKPDITIKGKTLIVKWDEDLAENTTYTFYFQDAIRDNNEANILNNYQYYFSTGAVVDSLSLSGNVYNADNLEAPTDVLVMLYSNLADTAPAKTLPAYITKPDFSGGFRISNIKPGDYRLYALNDLNGNRMFNSADEKFAFRDSVISITPKDFYGEKLDTIRREPPRAKGKANTAATPVKPDLYTVGRFPLYLFPGEIKTHYLTSSERQSAGSLIFTFSLPADTSVFSLKLLGEPDSTWYMEQNNTRDTFNIWIRDSLVYSKNMLEAKIRYPFTDSTGTVIYKSDTLKMRYLTKPGTTSRGRSRKLPSIFSPGFGAVVKPGTTISFNGISPLVLPDTSRIIFEQIIDTVRTRLKPQFNIEAKNSRKLNLTNKLTPGASYTIIWNKRALSDIYGHRNDSTVNKFKVATEEDYGKVNANLFGYDGDVIIQLLNDKEKVISQKKAVSPCKVTFPLIDNGKYRLRVIYDLDKNGLWTTGSYAEKRQPEPVNYFPAELDVKINWELDQDWDIGKKNSKDISLRSKPESKTSTR